MRGATPRIIRTHAELLVSIHAPRAGRDTTDKTATISDLGFNPRAPCGARQSASFSAAVYSAFQSTSPVRGATQRGVYSTNPRPVSIHAPRAGRDALPYRQFGCTFVSIHAPRAGRDGVGSTERLFMWGFNPRAPRGARPCAPCSQTVPRCFNPRAPCGARPSTIQTAVPSVMFQSTRPVRGATYHSCNRVCRCTVSIHAPRAGRDYHPLFSPACSLCFNPRAPCGARPSTGAAANGSRSFQSTRPVRGATVLICIDVHLVLVSIHAPHAGRDNCCNCCCATGGVSIHAPHAGRDPQAAALSQRFPCFNPRAPCGARPVDGAPAKVDEQFQSTRPVWGATAL